MLLPSSSSFIFLLMFPSLFVSFPPPVSLSVKSTSAFCFGVYAAVYVHVCVCPCVCPCKWVWVIRLTRSIAVSTRLPVHRRLWAYHSSAQRPHTISHVRTRVCACARVYACVRACEREREQARKGLKVRERAKRNGKWNFIRKLICFSHCGGTSISHQKIPPKTHRGR